MDSSILTTILKLIENKDLLNTITNLFSTSKTFSQNANINHQKKEFNNDLKSMPLYPEPLFYNQENKVQMQNNFDNSSQQNSDMFNLNTDISTLINKISSLNIPDLINNISPLISLFSKSNTAEKNNKKNTVEYGADDIDLQRIIRPD